MDEENSILLLVDHSSTTNALAGAIKACPAINLNCPVFRRFSFLSIYCLLLLSMILNCDSASAQLDGISEIGHSYQSDARGGCETSIGDTALAHVRQPASVLLQSRAKFDSKITNIFVLNNTWTNPIEKTSSSVNQLLSYNLGMVHRLGGKYAMGLAWETGGWQTSFLNQSLSRQLSRRAINSIGLKRYSVTANFGVKLTEKVFLGAGPHLDVIRFSTSLPVGDALLRWPSTYAVGAGYQVGMLYHPTKKISLGASYFSPSYLSNLSNQVDLELAGGRNLSTRAELGSLTLPGRVSWGVAYLPSEKLKMAVEGAYLNYGKSIFGDVQVKSPVSFRFSPGFRDIWVINTGLDYEISRNLAGSIGYVYNTRPVSASEMVPFYIANAQNQVTWGLRLKNERIWTGFAHVIGLPSISRSQAGAHADLGNSYPLSTVRQLLQSFNCGVGFSF